jgi:hypothetical protein
MRPLLVLGLLAIAACDFEPLAPVQISITAPDGRGPDDASRVDAGTTAPDARVAPPDAAPASLCNASNTNQFAEIPARVVTYRYSETTLVTSNYVYVLGGEASVDGSLQPIATVERAPLAADGSIGTFAIQPGTLAVARYMHASVTVPGTTTYVYLLGGSVQNGSVDTTSVERAAIRSDGTLGAFQVVPGVTLKVPRENFTATVVGGYLYAVGGYNAGTGGALGSIERAVIHADGTIEPFQLVSTTLSVPREGHMAVLSGNRLSILAGVTGPFNNLTNLSSVERAVVDGSGNLGPFSVVAAADLGHGRYDGTLSVIGDRVYVMSGCKLLQSAVMGDSSVQVAQLDGSGELGAFTTLPAPLPGGNCSMRGAVVPPNRLYAFSLVTISLACISP